MYSSIASLHIALDGRLQVLNSNRKQSIHPEQYDMAINDAILTVLKQRFSPELNSKKQGLEESIKRYTDLSNLKKEVSVEPLINNNQQFFYIPSDCYLPIVLNSQIYYSRDAFIKNTLYKTFYVTVITLDENTIADNELTLVFDDLTLNIDLKGITKSEKSMFYTLNYLKELFKEKNIDAYIENFENYRFDNSIILVSTYEGHSFTSGEGATFESFTFSRNIIDYTGISSFIVKNKKIDLVSSSDFSNIDNDYYLSKNIHLNPMYKLSRNRGVLKTTDNILYKRLALEYIKYPILVNSKLNRMTDFEITDEILDVATTNLSGILKDETYNINKQKEQFNN